MPREMSAIRLWVHFHNFVHGVLAILQSWNESRVQDPWARRCHTDVVVGRSETAHVNESCYESRARLVGRRMPSLAESLAVFVNNTSSLQRVADVKNRDPVGCGTPTRRLHQ